MQMMRRRMAPAIAVGVVVAAIAVDVLLSACGGSPTGPSDTPKLAVTITSSGPSPMTVRGPREGAFTVQFVNQDDQPHEVRSDPHPADNNCTALNIGVIAPGQSKETRDLQGCFVIIGRFTDRLTYHDEAKLDDSRFQGTIQR
jgi:hypothetical protein